MKAKIYILLTVLLLLPLIGLANPIVERYLNELKFEASGWKLEMNAGRIFLLDGWYLQSKSGTARFKNGILLGHNYLVITPESLLTPLSIDPLGDSLVLFSQFPRSNLTFGNTPAAMIAAPGPGQSICLVEGGSSFYLDNTPTMGGPNDFQNAMGTVRGTVRNSSGTLLSGVKVTYEQWPDRYVYTDSDGRFEFTDYARRDLLNSTLTGYLPDIRTVQVLPESTIVVNVTLHAPLNVVYPLHQGDRWDWGGWQRQVVRDTMMPNGMRYTTIQDPSNRLARYQRFESDRVYAYGFRGIGADQVIFDFSRSVQDTVTTFFDHTDTTDIILLSYREVPLFGAIRRQWAFLVDVRHVIDEELYQVVTDSIGVTHEEGVWFFADAQGAIINGVTYGTVSDVAEPRNPVVNNFRLHANYPNPFNPATTIEYDLPRTGIVTLEVYNILGQEVQSLVAGIQDAGRHRVRFNADAVQSGVYFYRLQAGGLVAVKKMLVLK